MIILPISQQDADNFIRKLTKLQENPKNFKYILTEQFKFVFCRKCF